MLARKEERNMYLIKWKTPIQKQVECMTGKCLFFFFSCFDFEAVLQTGLIRKYCSSAQKGTFIAKKASCFIRNS